ncbi:PerC transcriptional activator [Yokenella regensburgei]|uniref:PerC transcriptional activator n=1 Tax=Yokenella regensburgei TaxID=158877 RepID=A0ABX9S508_9ENTR|nr:PerC family transcriptional regulator [Yokenella regensburgei]RKR64988.1 PerC transcriptional activator [Yokenella regensburgei]VFS14523.1 PerC transcriptional activator [Yokenella regensburgei]
MTNERINQIDQVAVVVRHTPGCVLQDICEALDITSSSAGNLLRKLATSGRVIRNHNGTQYTYTVAPGANIPDVVLPYMLEKQDPEQLQNAERIAKELESRGLWRRAATVYTDILSLAANSLEVQRIVQRREECLRKGRIA